MEDALSVALGWGWLLMTVVLLRLAWKLYYEIKTIDYATALQWTYLQITIPEEAEQTPKSMENAFDTWDGIHKNPDLIEKYFDGMLEGWYSCEMQFTKNRVRYIMVVPAVHRTFFEGVIYGQYPAAEIREVEDYAQRYSYLDINKKFDLFGTKIILAEDDFYPVKTYRDYEDELAEEERYIDPHQAMIEAYTNIEDWEEIWVQILVRPVDASVVAEWGEKAAAVIDELAGKDVVKPRGILALLGDGLFNFVGDFVRAVLNGPLEAGDRRGRDSGTTFPKVSALDTARMDGILHKISKGGYETTIRAVYLAPVGKIKKPNQGRLLGGFKQYNTVHLNSFKPDPDTKTNAADYILKEWRRYWKKRHMLLRYQWRDPGTLGEGFFMSGEELATLYHFPVKYVRAPAVERAKAGSGSAPDNVPYV